MVRLTELVDSRISPMCQALPRLLVCMGLLLAAGCTTPPPQETPGDIVQTKPPAEPPPPPHTGVLARNDRFAVVLPRAEDTLASLAREFLGHSGRAWEIAQFNQITQASSGQALVVPLQPVNPAGISAKGYQTVPILCYHRVGPRTSLMVMPRETFAAQMEYLAAHDYNVIRLADLPDFLSGKRPLPPRAVAISFDDSHVSSYSHAFPILRKHGFAATFFMYTDFLGAGEGLTWAQIHEMSKSGLIDFQSHSKTHANLIVRQAGETDSRYRDRIETELRAPRETLERHLGSKVTQHAYPYGDANQVVLERLLHTGHQLGFTVNPGGNAFFAHPLLLKRTMIFGATSLESFRSVLQVFRDVNLQ
jgi:peptidoglycan/xylan/chitin deacetylase (PgdA/CDA1 family)